VVPAANFWQIGAFAARHTRTAPTAYHPAGVKASERKNHPFREITPIRNIPINRNIGPSQN